MDSQQGVFDYESQQAPVKEKTKLLEVEIALNFPVISPWVWDGA